MTIQEYDAMMAAKGTPKVWVVSYAIACPGIVHTKLFATEKDARAFANGVNHLISCGQTWDIWGWTARHNH